MTNVMFNILVRQLLSWLRSLHLYVLRAKRHNIGFNNVVESSHLKLSNDSSSDYRRGHNIMILPFIRLDRSVPALPRQTPDPPLASSKRSYWAYTGAYIRIYDIRASGGW